MIRNAMPADATRLAEIYNHYIQTSHSTFEIEPVDAAEMERRRTLGNGKYPFLVAEESESVAGYAYGREFRPRAAYVHTVEVSVYLDYSVTGKGLGTRLYEVLIEDVKRRGYHAVIGGISLPNDASVRLHEKFGFQKCAEFRQVGRKFDRWIDVGYWQLIL
jgi:phosphinothricin acetyltransferase